MSAKLSPMQIYAVLPKKNCGECGVPTCLAFAFKVSTGEIKIEICPYITEETKTKMAALVAPPVKLITIGVGEKAVKIGGEEVVHRHEKKFNNETALAIEISDLMDAEQITKRLEKANSIKVVRMGQTLNLNLIAVRGASANAQKFAETVKLVKEKTTFPLILCSFDPNVIEAGLNVVGADRPLIYAADENNLGKIAELAKRYNCPLTVYSPHNLEKMFSLIQQTNAAGVSDLVLDVGLDTIIDAINDLTILRRLAVKKGFKPAGYPTIAFPALSVGKPFDFESGLWEAAVGSILLLKYAGILVLRGTEIWEILSLLTLRQNIFTDPQKPVRVEPGLIAFGQPDENSPILMTTNFALTYYTVAGDIESAKTNCYLLVVDTEGLSVITSIAGEKLTAEKVGDALKKFEAEKKVKHRQLVIPGTAAKISGKIEDSTGWKVLVGPKDSGEIGAFVKDKWEQKQAS